MTLTKMTIETGGRGSARAAAERLGLLVPEPVAVTEFERPGASSWVVEAYFAEAPALTDTRAVLGPEFVGHGIAIERVPDENWVAISQAALPPVIAGRFVVHGSHDRARVGRRATSIEIDAGEAFGTAHHATTLGVLMALDTLGRRRPFRRVLDLGCGSGVLAIAASRILPAAAITASDIDPAAVDVARANARLNRAQGRLDIVCAAGLSHDTLRKAAPFDLVLANILAGPLIVLAPTIARVIVPGGTAVLSGILCEQSREVEAAWRAAGFTVQQKRLLNGWVTLVLDRRNERPGPLRLSVVVRSSKLSA